MIVAVTGSSGFIGKNLVERLKLSGHEVLRLDISEGIDILDWNNLEKIKSFDVLVHLAAKSFVPDSYIYPHAFYQVNVLGTLNMLELARKNKAKFIFVSSYVYGTPKYLPIDESHPLDSFNPYAASKIIGEELCRSFHRFFNLNTLIVRPFNIYGIGQNSNFLISSIFEQAKEGKVILKDSRPKRDYIFIDDVIEALKICVIKDINGLETINLGSGISYSVLEIVQIVNSFYSNTLQIHFTGEERTNEVLDTVADISNAFKILNWKPQISLLEGIKKIINGK